MNYKKGQCIIVLPVAERDGIPPDAVDSKAIIVEDNEQASLAIRFVNKKRYWWGKGRWWVNSIHIKLASYPGEQLVFDFMEDA
jgi:hypothetical protein